MHSQAKLEEPEQTTKRSQREKHTKGCQPKNQAIEQHVHPNLPPYLRQYIRILSYLKNLIDQIGFKNDQLLDELMSHFVL